MNATRLESPSTQNPFSALTHKKPPPSGAKPGADDGEHLTKAARRRRRRKKAAVEPADGSAKPHTCAACSESSTSEFNSCSCGFELCTECRKKNSKCPGCRNSLKETSITKGFTTVTHSKPRVASKRKEIPLHQRFMDLYHTKMCEKFLSAGCNLDPNECFNSHSSSKLRRVPVSDPTHSSGYNYIPNRCPYQEGKSKCQNGDKCRYSHTKSEMIYHPLVYKTTTCDSKSDVSGMCVRRGARCYKSHGEKDTRRLSEAQQDLAKLTKTDGHKDSSGRRRSGARWRSNSNSHKDDRTVHNATKDPIFYMFVYKTQKCVNPRCNNPRVCTDFHHEQERRRNPKRFPYSAEPCSSVKCSLDGSTGPSTKWREPSRCKKGDACEYSHSLLEQMYHPHIYKTIMCSNFSDPKGDKCLWGNLCTHAHGDEDLRIRVDAKRVYYFKDPSATTAEAPTNGVKKSPLNGSHVSSVIAPNVPSEWSQQTESGNVIPFDQIEPASPASISSASQQSADSQEIRSNGSDVSGAERRNSERSEQCPAPDRQPSPEEVHSVSLAIVTSIANGPRIHVNTNNVRAARPTIKTDLPSRANPTRASAPSPVTPMSPLGTIPQMGQLEGSPLLSPHLNDGWHPGTPAGSLPSDTGFGNAGPVPCSPALSTPKSYWSTDEADPFVLGVCALNTHMSDSEPSDWERDRDPRERAGSTHSFGCLPIPFSPTPAPLRIVNDSPIYTHHNGHPSSSHSVPTMNGANNMMPRRTRQNRSASDVSFESISSIQSSSSIHAAYGLSGHRHSISSTSSLPDQSRDELLDIVSRLRLENVQLRGEYESLKGECQDREKAVMNKAMGYQDEVKLHKKYQNETNERLQMLETLTKCPACSCGDRVRNRALTPCGHVICSECFERVTNTRDARSPLVCPLCHQICNFEQRLNFN